MCWERISGHTSRQPPWDSWGCKIGATIRQIFGGDGILVGARGTNLLGGPRPDAARLTIDDIAAVADTVAGIAAWDPQ